jgi:hypothetical protein
MKPNHWNKLLLGCLALAVLLAHTVVSAGPDVQQQTLRSLKPPSSGQSEVTPAVGGLKSDNQQQETTRYNLSNGLDVVVYSSDLLASRLTWQGGEPVIPLEDGRYLSVIIDINHPSIYNKGDGLFHPFEESKVIGILNGISHPNLDLELKVFILPYPRNSVLVSSTSDNEIFLSPHVLDIHPTVAAYIVAHEMGHVFHNAYMPDGSPLWDRYRWVRGIDDPVKYCAAASHAYRPREIFAEDFRVLFGGTEAALGGRVENPELVSPLAVAGLKGFFENIGGTPVARGPKVRASNYPNPFNPETEIRIVLPDEIVNANERVTVKIFDVRGALVKVVYSDVPFGENLYVRWDGRDRHGNSVASSNYFALIEAGQARTTLKLVLLK